jgi:phosphoglycerate dehydrogenase-like enzyme
MGLISLAKRIASALSAGRFHFHNLTTNPKLYISHGAIELAWALILAIVRNVPAEIASLKSGGWQISVGGDLQGKTIGILGLGNIGARIARIADAFGMNILAWSQNLTRESAEKHGAHLVSKEELFRAADIVTIHLVLSPRTRGFVGATELGLSCH